MLKDNAKTSSRFWLSLQIPSISKEFIFLGDLFFSKWIFMVSGYFWSGKFWSTKVIYNGRVEDFVG